MSTETITFPYRGLTVAQVQVRQLSAGTWATLTNLCTYTEIDALQTRVVTFVDKFADEFTCWQDAWEAFKIAQSQGEA